MKYLLEHIIFIIKYKCKKYGLFSIIMRIYIDHYHDIFVNLFEKEKKIFMRGKEFK